ncbi:tetratricopeptide repeat protein [Roseibium sp. HPY-6]|uniref:tetratricopeptide repeat protein n=1 Tax=Roseibium sp. HPY-6 TaxID=3229852 RepID=UPI00338D6CE3
MNLAKKHGRTTVCAALIFSALVLAGCSSSEERAQDHYERGVEFAEQGDLSKAGIEFRNAIKLDSNRVDALFAFGEIQERQGDLPAAFRVYTSVSEQASDHIQSRVKLVYMLLSANQLDRAKEKLDEAIAISPEELSVLVAKASFELRNRNPDEAEKIAKKAFSLDPTASDALIVLASARMLAKDPEGALQYLNQAPADSDKHVGLQVLRMSVLEALDDQDGIEDLFENLVETFPDTPQFSQAWVRWYLSQDREDDAERVVRKFAADRFENNEAQLALVSFLISRRGPDVGRAELDSIIKQRNEQNIDSFEIRLALGELMYNTGEVSEGIEVIESVVADTSDEQQKNQARLMLATMLGRSNDMAQAEELINEVLENDTKNVEALRLRSRIKITRNDNAGAVDDILLALNEAPEDARLRTMLASAYERDGASILAEEQFARALALADNAPEVGLPMVQFLLRHGKAEQSLRVLEALRERNPTNRQVLTLLAQQRLARRDFVGAQEISDTLRQIENGSSETADKIAAAALGGLDRHDESIALLQNSSAATNDDEALLPDLIRAYVQAGRQDAAEEHLNSVLTETPENTLAKVLLGSVYLSQNRSQDAEAQFLSAAAESESVLGNTSLAQYYLATRKFDEAEGTIRDGLEKQNDNMTLRLMLTTVLQQMQRFDEAIDEYEIMFASDPESTIVANDLASLLSERRGDEASLDRAFEIAQRFRSSEVPQYMDTLGWVYYLRGEHSSALPLLRNASQKLPNMGLVQFHYGMALAALNQKDQAINSLEKALDLKTMMTEDDLKEARATVERLKNSDGSAESN